MFTAALFTIAKTWQQPKCPWTDDWIKKMWCVNIPNGILLSHKKNKIMPFAATWMELETLILNEVSQKEKDKCRIFLFMAAPAAYGSLQARGRIRAADCWPTPQP